MMYTQVNVKHILDRKGYQVWSIPPGATVHQALELMAEKNIGALVVMEAEQLVGIFSERDYARKVGLRGRNDRETFIRDVMTSRVVGVQLHQDVSDCLALMTEKFIRHLPVVDDQRRILGVISIGDVVKELVLDQKYVIDQLVNYISGEKPKPHIPEKSQVDLP